MERNTPTPNETTYDEVQALGGDIGGDELVVEYEKASGGTKVIGGEVINAHESYNNREDTRTVIIDIKSHAGSWRIKAVNHVLKDVTLHSISHNNDGEIETTRISTRDGVKVVEHADEWTDNDDDDNFGKEMECDMCEQKAEHDVTTTRKLLRLCPDCLNGQERAGVVEAVQDVGMFYKSQHEKASREKHWV